MVKRRGFVFVDGLIFWAVTMLLLAIGITAFIHFLVYPLGRLGWFASVLLLAFVMMFGFWIKVTRTGR